MPNLDKDGPTKFRAKVTTGIKLQKLAIARYNYVMKNGFEVKRDKDGNFQAAFDGDGRQLTIDGMAGVIDRVGEEIEAKLIAEGMNEQQAFEQAHREVMNMFFGG